MVNEIQKSMLTWDNYGLSVVYLYVIDTLSLSEGNNVSLLLLKYKLEQTYTALGNADKVVQYSSEYIQLKDILLNPGL